MPNPTALASPSNVHLWIDRTCLEVVIDPTGIHSLQKGMSVSYNPNDINSRVGATVFDDVNAIAGKVNSSSATRNEFYGVVDCYPFLTLLLASNMTKIDFMRLDVEGFELKILQTIPWDKIKIRVSRNLRSILLDMCKRSSKSYPI